MPDASPTAAETVVERTSENGVTTVGHPAESATIRAIAIPTTSPAMPPARLIADADLLRPLEDRRQHDVHDPDAADEERDPRDARHHDREESLRPAALLEEE